MIIFIVGPSLLILPVALFDFTVHLNDFLGACLCRMSALTTSQTMLPCIAILLLFYCLFVWNKVTDWKWKMMLVLTRRWLRSPSRPGWRSWPALRPCSHTRRTLPSDSASPSTGRNTRTFSRRTTNRPDTLTCPYGTHIYVVTYVRMCTL